jgi:hypothetical protein
MSGSRAEAEVVSISAGSAVFVRAGWADGIKEPFEFTDIDRTVAGGVSIAGKQWGRSDDTIGIAVVINNIASVYQAFLMLVVWESSSATDCSRTPGSKRSSRPITATLCPPRRDSASIISSLTIPVTTRTGFCLRRAGACAVLVARRLSVLPALAYRLAPFVRAELRSIHHSP